jgi:hypothetical protein
MNDTGLSPAGRFLANGEGGTSFVRLAYYDKASARGANIDAYR